MNPPLLRRSVVSLALPLLLACGLAQAQSNAPAPSAAPASAPVAAARAHIVVIEDEGARIEELRVGGVLRGATVQSKIGGVRPYQILVAPAGRDTSQERGTSGQRVWSVLNF